MIAAMQLLLKKSPRAYSLKIVKRLKLKGYPFNHERIYQVYCGLGLPFPRRVERSLPKWPLVPLSVESRVNSQWPLDFMRDTLYYGKRFRVLNNFDELTRECLANEVDASLPDHRLVRVMEQLKVERGLPRQVRADNGLELISCTFVDWCEERGIEVVRIQKGSHSKMALRRASTARSASSLWTSNCSSR